MGASKPSNNHASDDKALQDAELKELMRRRDSVERRAVAHDDEWDRLAAAVERWAKKHQVRESKSALLLRLVTLPPHLHRTERARSEVGAEYNRLETAATNLLLRRRALEAEFVALHEELHDWAHTYGVELETEEIVTQMTLTEPMKLAAPTAPFSCFGNIWGCRLRPDGSWLDYRICCRPKKLAAQA